MDNNYQTQFRETEIGLIPEEWDFDALEKHADIIMGQSPESTFYNMSGEGLEFMQGVRTFGEKYPIFDTWTTKTTKFAKNGSVLLSVRAPVGEVNITDRDLCIGRGLMAINGENNEFIYQLLKASKEYIVGQETGTVYGSVTRDDIAKLELPFPPLSEQRQIAEILSSLDDKIELNRKINANLEKIASAIFKKWFVDIGDELPSRKLSDMGSVVCGKTPPKSSQEYFGGDVPFIKIPDMHSQVFIIRTEDSLTEKGKSVQSNKTIPKGSVCVSCIATVGLVSMTSEDSQTNQQINSIVPKKPEYTYYLYLALKSMEEELKNMASGGSATLNLNTGHFSDIEMPFPDDRTLKEFDSLVRPLFAGVLRGQVENERLAQIRDSLLPRLMSGKIRVKI